MAITIPKRYERHLATMAAISSDGRQKLLDAMDSTPVVSMQGLATHVTETSGLDVAEVQATLIVAASLLRVREGSASEAAELARDVAHEAAAEQLGGLASDDTDAVSAFSDFLLGLIEREPIIGVAAKVASLLYDHPYVYLDSRILTDFRPLFDEGKDVKNLRGGAVIHTLRLNVGSETGKDSTWYVALDQSDLTSLRSTIDRAIEKDRILRQTLTDAKIPLADSEE